jgi:demethylmenaquinone methyltransferase / 2-methoxy-6-polyprenyl-1,4-benzoquinol methylase
MYDKNQPETIQEMFSSIAKGYDRTNAILSLGLHRYWNRALVKRVTQGLDTTLLDLCAGSGDIAYTYLKSHSTPQRAILIDFCPEMLACAKEKARKLQWHQISFIQADVQALPLENQSVTNATMAYGIRNVKDPKKCFEEVYRVLAPGGCFGILELTQPTHPLIRSAHAFYLKRILPLVGKWLTDNREAYRYLCNSIQAFISPIALEQMLRDVGFKETALQRLTFGTATLIFGRK